MDNQGFGGTVGHIIKSGSRILPTHIIQAQCTASQGKQPITSLQLLTFKRSSQLNKNTETIFCL